jgi:TPR repeat protein
MSVHLLNDMDFLEGGLTEEDVDLAKINAQKGNPEAQYHLAMMFDTGRSVTRNPKEAESWYKKAAAQGHAGAQFYLAKMYSTETSGIAKNEAEAILLFKSAAEQGHQGAINRLYS